MIEEGLFEFVKTNTALEALLPSANGLFMGFVPESAEFPCLMFKKVSAVHDSTLDGPSGYVERRYQFTSIGKDATNAPGSGYVSAQLVADNLRQQFNGFTGNLPDGTRVYNVILDTEIDLYDSDEEQYFVIQDYMIEFLQNP